jgi:hypothetical protein
MNFKLDYDEGSDILQELDLAAELDRGWSGVATLNDRWSNVRRGAKASLDMDGGRLPLVVRDYSTPWRNGRQRIQFCDPISAAIELNRETLCLADERASFERLIQTRSDSCGGPSELGAALWPHLVVDGLTLRECLVHICAQHGDWHLFWRDGKCHLGQLADAAPARPLKEVANEADVAGGFEADVYLGAPMIGEVVTVSTDERNERRGVITRLRVDPCRPLVCRITVQETPLRPLERIRPTGCLLRPGTVTRVDPLIVRVHVDDSQPEVRGRLFSLSMAACELVVPLQAGDPVLVAWPVHALTTEPLPVLPLGVVSAGEFLRLITERLDIDERKRIG